MYTYHRSDRVAEELQRQVSTIIQQRISDPRLKLLSITDVKLSPDLKNATVFYSLSGQPPVEAEEALKKASKAIRSMLTDRMAMRRVPLLNFVFDESQESAHRISSLLHNIALPDEAEELDGLAEA